MFKAPFNSFIWLVKKWFNYYNTIITITIINSYSCYSNNSQGKYVIYYAKICNNVWNCLINISVKSFFFLIMEGVSGVSVLWKWIIFPQFESLKDRRICTWWIIQFLSITTRLMLHSRKHSASKIHVELTLMQSEKKNNI